MHFVISATWGPTDPTRAMLPFLLGASALQAGDELTIMLFHDAVFLAVDGLGPKLVPVGPPNVFDSVLGNTKAKILACKPCFEVRGLAADRLHARIALAGMNEFHAAASHMDARVVSY